MIFTKTIDRETGKVIRSGGQPSRTSCRSGSRRKKSAIGDNLKAIIAREIPGAMSCGDCRALIQKLNQKSPKQIRADIDSIVLDIFSRSETQAPRLWQRLAVKLDKAAHDAIPAVHLATMKMLHGEPIDTTETEHRIRTWVLEAVQKAESAAKPGGKLTAGKNRSHLAAVPDYKPPSFTSVPRLTLMFHVWPKTNWQWHFERLKPHLHRFDRLMLGVATDDSTDTLADVLAVAGTRWEVFPVENKPGKTGLREVATYQKMMPLLEHSVNDVTFCLHAKGVQQHNTRNSAVSWWTEAMYTTVYDNIDGVVLAMRDGACIVGSFRRYGRHFTTKYGWHFSGTFYAFRNHAAFFNRTPVYKHHWWGTESWPGDYFHVQQSHCVFGDNTGDLYHARNQPREQFEQWKVDNGLASSGT